MRTIHLTLCLLPLYASTLLAAPIGPDDFQISTMGTDGNIAPFGAHAVVSYNPIDNEYLVVWTGSKEDHGTNIQIWGQRLNAATGQPVGEDDFQISLAKPTSTPRQPAIAFNTDEGEFLVAWVQPDAADNTGAPVGSEVFVRRVSQSGVPQGPVRQVSMTGLTTGTPHEASHPDLVYNSSDGEYLIVWEADLDHPHPLPDDYEIFGRILTSTGAGDGSQFQISSMGVGPLGEEDYNGFAPAAAWSEQANNYAVVWHGDDQTPPLADDEFEIFIQILDEDGNEIGTDDRRVSDMGSAEPGSVEATYGKNPDIAAGPGYFIVTWDGIDIISKGNEIFAALVALDGGFYSTSIEVSATPGTHDSRLPSVAYDPIAQRHLIVWLADTDSPTNAVTFGHLDVHGRYFGESLLVQGDEFKLGEVTPNHPDFAADKPDVAFNTTNLNYLTVWNANGQKETHANLEQEIYGQLWTYLPASGFRLTDVSISGVDVIVSYQSNVGIESKLTYELYRGSDLQGFSKIQSISGGSGEIQSFIDLEVTGAPRQFYYVREVISP